MSASCENIEEKVEKMNLSPMKAKSVLPKEKPKDGTNKEIEGLKREVVANFWHYTKEFIQAINTAPGKPESSWIQFQTYRTYYYGVMASAISYESPSSKTLWVCVKVGFTQLDDAMKRPAQVCAEIIKHIVGPEPEETTMEVIRGQVRTIFCIPQASSDPRLPVEVEKAVRLTIGTPLHKKEAKELELPIPTEWVVANIQHLKEIISVCQVETADSSEITKRGEYRGALPPQLKLEKSSRIIPETVIPSL